MFLVSIFVRLFLSLLVLLTLLVLLSLLLFLSSASVASFSVIRGAGARRGGPRPEATTRASGPGTSASLPPHFVAACRRRLVRRRGRRARRLPAVRRGRRFV